MPTLNDILTPKQVRAAVKIWNSDRRNFHRRVLDEIVTPAMPEIDRKLGQQNDARYIAYLIEYVFTESR